MKTLYLVGGAMGVGKTTVCRRLKVLATQQRILGRRLVLGYAPLSNHGRDQGDGTGQHLPICCIIPLAARLSEYHLLLGPHEQSILDSILARLDLKDCSVKSVSLVCDAAHLTARLQRDVERGIRMPDVIGRSLSRVPLYEG